MPVEKEKDPLDSLFVKGDEVNRELLKEVLTPYVRLDEKGRIFPLKPFYGLTKKKQVVVLLLTRKVIFLKTGAEEAASPSELAKTCDMPDGTLRPMIGQLVEERIAENENSDYRIFPQALHRCAELLALKDDGVELPAGGIQKTASRSKNSMSSVIDDLIRQGGLDEGKTAREIFELARQRRPGTIYNALYKVLLDMVHSKKLTRQIKDESWLYTKTMNE